MSMAKYVLNSGEVVHISADPPPESVQAAVPVSAMVLIKEVLDPAFEDALGRARKYGPDEIRLEIEERAKRIKGRPAVAGSADGDFAWLSEPVVSIPCVDEGIQGSFA